MGAVLVRTASQQGEVWGLDSNNIKLRMKLENGVNGLRDVNHNDHKKIAGRMAYITVKENAVKWWITVQGLNHREVRLLTEKVSDQPESHDVEEKTVEYSIPSWQVLNGLEQMGYRVVTSSCLVTGYTKHDTRDFIWTMHKDRAGWEAASM